MSITLSALQKQRRDTAANWTAENPTLLAGEIGIESDTGKIKIGNGSTAWASLGYQGIIPSSGAYPLNQLLMPSGTVSAPSISFDGDTNLGIYRSGTDQLSFTTAGTERLRIDAAGQIEAVSLGTAAAPTFSFTGDPNTGIYSPGADQVAISTGGSGRLFVDASGNIGVGTTTAPPAGHIARFSSFVFAPGFTVNTSGDTGIYSTIANTLQFQTNGSEKVRITSAGLVGIGTSALPGSGKLQVAGDNASTSIGSAECLTLLDGNASNEFNILNFATSVGGTIARIGAKATTTGGYPNSVGELHFAVQNGGSTNTALVIDSSSRVGIGTTNVPAPFCVSRSGNEGLEVTPLTGNQVEIQGYNRTTSNWVAALNKFSQHIWNLNSTTEAARIDTSGRLLVGTSSARSNFYNSTVDSRFLLESNSVASGERILANVHNSATANGPILLLAKSRSTSIGGNTVVADSDALGAIDFQGNDGSEFVLGARIQAEVDGTPGSNDMPGRLVFSTTADGASSPTPRMTIRNDGEVLINKTSSFGTVHSLGVFKANNALGVGTDAGTGQEAVRFYNGATAVGTISTTGSSTAYNTSSDYRLKENVAPVTDGITRLQQLKPSRFNFIADPDKTVDGFLAHEAAEVVPECVTGEKDAVDEEGNPQYQGIDQSKLVPLLTAALQEAVAKIESLETRLTAAGI